MFYKNLLLKSKCVFLKKKDSLTFDKTLHKLVLDSLQFLGYAIIHTCNLLFQDRIMSITVGRVKLLKTLGYRQAGAEHCIQQHFSLCSPGP